MSILTQTDITFYNTSESFVRAGTYLRLMKCRSDGKLGFSNKQHKILDLIKCTSNLIYLNGKQGNITFYKNIS